MTRRFIALVRWAWHALTRPRLPSWYADYHTEWLGEPPKLRALNERRRRQGKPPIRP